MVHSPKIHKKTLDGPKVNMPQYIIQTSLKMWGLDIRWESLGLGYTRHQFGFQYHLIYLIQHHPLAQRLCPA